MNLPLIVVITLTLFAPFNIGLANGNNKGTTQAQFDKLEVQAQTEEGVITVTKTIGPDGGGIGIPYNEEFVGVFFPEGALLRDVEVTIRLIEEPATNYPPRYNETNYKGINLTDWPAKIEYTGPQVVIELPLDALDWQNRHSLEDEFNGFKYLFYVMLVHFDGTAMESRERSEIRYWTEANELELDLGYIRKGTNAFVDADIRAYFYEASPEILRISVQPVDSTKLFNDNGQILPRIDPQAYWDTDSQDMTHFEGLLKPDGDYLEYLFC